MDLDQYPRGLPEPLRAEYDKYIKDPKRYEKLYPVCFRILKSYIGTPDVKEKDQRKSSRK